MNLAPSLWDRTELLPGREELPEGKNLISTPAWFRLRQYQDSDREEVRRICCETGFLGNPIDPIFQDRELFADLFTNAYLDFEPEWTLVVESEGRIAGYLTGSVSPHFNRNLMLDGFQTACKMLRRLLTGRYSAHPRSEQFVRWVLAKGLIEQPKHPEGASHLHLNLEKPLRWGSVARRLLLMYEDRLFAAGIYHYYVKFFSCSQRSPERMYHHLGFEVYDRMASTIFYPEIPDNFYVVCAHKRLNGSTPPPGTAARRGSHFTRNLGG